MTSNADTDSVNTETDTLTDFAKKEQFTEEYSDLFTEPQIDWLVRKREENGLAESGAIVLVSRKIYFHRRRFARWLAAQRR